MSQEHTVNRTPLVILTYHQIDAAPPSPAPFRSLYVSPRDFAWQMALLHRLGYQGLSISALRPYLLGERSGRVVGISFDDGYLNNLSHALPVLQRHGFSSTCYAVSRLLGQTNQWDREVGIAPALLMDAAQLRQWVDGGQEVGAHTRHHVHLPLLDPAAAGAEIGLCRSELEAACGAAVTQFCYPYGEFEAQHIAIARAAGYLSASTTRRGRCHAGTDLMQLPRVPVLRSTSLATLWLKLATGYEDRRSASGPPSAAASGHDGSPPV